MLGAKTAMTIHDFSARLGTGEERRLTLQRKLSTQPHSAGLKSLM